MIRRRIDYGYNEKGEFVIELTEAALEDDGETIAEGPFESSIILMRKECQRISKHMEFGKKGDMRSLKTMNGELTK
jgi:hypothetical protein